MFQVAVLASGSKGNCIVVKTDTTKILLDAGLSGKKTIEMLNSLDLDEQKIGAVILSHEHSDHTKGAGIICRKLKIPLYLTEPTFFEISHSIGKLPLGKKYFVSGDKFTIGDIEVQSFPSSHDAIDGSNFIFQQSNIAHKKLAIATDLGYSSKLLIAKLQDVSTIILESNHDPKMLMDGPYPWPLKQRVRGRQGHLSNEQAVGVISQIMHPALENIILAHLSEENNCPKLAFKVMKQYLNSIDANTNLYTALQHCSTGLIDI